MISVTETDSITASSLSMCVCVFSHKPHPKTNKFSTFAEALYFDW